jgi:membrane protein required for colicin V production
MELGHLDYAIIAVLLISASLSLIRGFTKEVLSITGWIVSGYAAIFFSPSLKPLLAAYVQIDWVVNGGAMLIVFLVTLVAFSFAGAFITKTMKASPLGPLDRTMGIIFGGLRGVFIVCMAYLGLSAVIPENDHPDFVKDAKLRPMLQTGSKAVVAIVPLDRLPINLSSIGNTVSEKGNEALQDISGGILREAIEQGAEELSGQGEEVQDSTPDKGYKQGERGQIERLIRNTEGVSQ